MQSTSRNDALEFARRTRKNLLYIQKARQAGEDVHEVTQLTLSLLGLIIFPWEKKLVERFKSKQLADLAAEGWPKWHIEVGNSGTLYDLVKLLRHGTAHGNISFSSDSRDSDEVSLTVKNYPPKSQSLNWQATIKAKDLENFCFKFISLIEEATG